MTRVFIAVEVSLAVSGNLTHLIQDYREITVFQPHILKSNDDERFTTVIDSSFRLIQLQT